MTIDTINNMPIEDVQKLNNKLAKRIITNLIVVPAIAIGTVLLVTAIVGKVDSHNAN